MYKNIILLISLALLMSCSQTKVEKKVSVPPKIKAVDTNKTVKKDIVVPVVEEEFIPKHIRLSHIEVVPH